MTCPMKSFQRQVSRHGERRGKRLAYRDAHDSVYARTRGRIDSAPLSAWDSGGLGERNPREGHVDE